MSDTQLRNEAPTGPDYTALATNSAIPHLAVVTPNTPTAAGRGTVELCASDGSIPTGLALAAALEGAEVQVQAVGVVSAPPAAWDARTGDSGGLTDGAVYYVSQSTDGNLTKTEPGSGTVTPVGVGLGPTSMLLFNGSLPFNVIP